MDVYCGLNSRLPEGMFPSPTPARACDECHSEAIFARLKSTAFPTLHSTTASSRIPSTRARSRHNPRERRIFISTMDPSSPLTGLENTGCKVDRHGRLSNWADRPPHIVRPVMQQRAEGKRPQQRFLQEELKVLAQFCTAAQEQDGVVGNSVFTELACLVSRPLAMMARD